MDARFSHQQYTVRRKVFQFFGGSFHIYDPNGNVAFFSKMKRFKLKEDIQVYTEEARTHEVLRIKARQMLDFGATYDVIDSVSGEAVGALRRKGFKSILKDEWLFLDLQGTEIGQIREDNLFLALLRRLLANWGLGSLVPQTYYGDIGGQQICTFKQNFNPFVMKITLDFSDNTSGLLDLRLGIAAAILLCAIEGKQG